MPKKHPKEEDFDEKTIQVRIWPELMPYLLDRAVMERRSMVQVVNMILESAITPVAPKPTKKP